MRASTSNLARSCPSSAFAQAAWNSLAVSLPSASSLSSTAEAVRMPGEFDKSKSLPILPTASATESPEVRSLSNSARRPTLSLVRSKARLRASAILSFCNCKAAA
ncbi:hypothetical protein D3C71_1694790 [compost metagenome]